jgi:hypothetical protein
VTHRGPTERQVAVIEALAVKALAYFGDADAASLPAGLTEETWAAVRAATVARVRSL